MKKDKSITNENVAFPLPVVSGSACLPINPNIMYLVDLSSLKDVAVSNYPRLADGDVVVITGYDYVSAKKYWIKRNINCYKVKLIKKLCRVRRAAKDIGHVSHVPECVLRHYR